MNSFLTYYNLIKGILLFLLFASGGNLIAQDYLISFAGSGASMSVNTVKVENITRGTSLTMDGDNILKLKGVVTGMESAAYYKINKIEFLPNPISDHARMKFFLSQSGETIITLHDLSGKKVTETRALLPAGQHTYSIENPGHGVFIVTVQTDRYSISGRLLSTGSRKGNLKIEYEDSEIEQENIFKSKGTAEETEMQYTTGDRLKLTGISGDFSTVITDVPSASKTITFNFVPCKDADGNDYPVVMINTPGKSTTEDGAGLWMAENLKTTKLNDDSSIPNVTSEWTWADLETPAYCWYNNTHDYKEIYGALYNWYAVLTGKLCPEGWHVPTDAEWVSLSDYTGGSEVSGGKLKETGTAHWDSPNTGASNETGFTALPGGFRIAYPGYFYSVGEKGFWWSSTEGSAEGSTEKAWNHYIYNNYSVLWRDGQPKKFGMSVRCIKDQPGP